MNLMDGSQKAVVGITMGDPAGIGPEVIVKAYDTIRDCVRPVVIGDADVMERVVENVGVEIPIVRIEDVEDTKDDGLAVLDLDNVERVEFGEVKETYGRASLEYVERAIDLANAEKIDAIVTAPINKQSTTLAGSKHAGHTGLLAERTNTESYSMMLIEDDLRVTHVCTHVPLKQACDLVSTETVLDTIRVSNRALQELGITAPRIAVAGLNPHAGEGGVLGTEDEEHIRPAVRTAREEGIDANGPQSPDTVFVQAARGDFDCVVAMYHDQGHIPIKMLGFSEESAVSGVNVTIGLPIIRTSVDHGTAFDIAGQGVASEQSMIDAVETAASLANARTGRDDL